MYAGDAFIISPVLTRYTLLNALRSSWQLQVLTSSFYKLCCQCSPCNFLKIHPRQSLRSFGIFCPSSPMIHDRGDWCGNISPQILCLQAGETLRHNPCCRVARIRLSWLPPLCYLASFLPHLSSWEHFSNKSPPPESLVHDECLRETLPKDLAWLIQDTVEIQTESNSSHILEFTLLVILSVMSV